MLRVDIPLILKEGHMDGFRRFVLRGNVVDLAVAVVIGAAFGAIVTSLGLSSGS